MRRDIIEEAVLHPEILFPVFSNGTMMNSEYIHLFDRHRNIVPIISIEGGIKETDARRGDGVYAQTVAVMRELQTKEILFGVSVTVTTENLDTVTKHEFIDDLQKLGCTVGIFVEYVPVERQDLALDLTQREYLQLKLNALRNGNEKMMLSSFPGDEKYYGGCLAAGRGFFHINGAGGAEPCPFSPFSDTSLKNTSLRDALHSPLFQRLQDSDMLLQEHTGGCLLFEHKNDMERLADLP